MCVGVGVGLVVIGGGCIWRDEEGLGRQVTEKGSLEGVGTRRVLVVSPGHAGGAGRGTSERFLGRRKWGGITLLGQPPPPHLSPGFFLSHLFIFTFYLY